MRAGRHKCGNVGIPEGAVFSPDRTWLYVGIYADKNISVLRVDGNRITDTGKPLALPGSPASMRGGCSNQGTELNGQTQFGVGPSHVDTTCTPDLIASRRLENAAPSLEIKKTACEISTGRLCDA